MEALGRHCIIEYYDCTREILDDPDEIRELMCRGAEAMGATIVACEFHHFSPQGVSGMIVISESHLSIHTWPEYGYAAVDVFTCGEVVDPWRAHKVLRELLGSGRESVVELKRGVMDVPPGTLPKEYAVKAPLRS